MKDVKPYNWKSHLLGCIAIVSIICGLIYLWFAILSWIFGFNPDILRAIHAIAFSLFVACLVGVTISVIAEKIKGADKQVL